MADPKIKIKRSSVEGKIPTADQVPLGEIALNTYDGKLFASKNVGIGTTVFAINPWSVGTGTNTYNTFFTVGNVGIGTTNPTESLSVVGKIQVHQDNSSNNRLIFRGQPGSSYRWNIDNYSSANEFRIFREDDATSANGSVAVSISTTGTVTATKFSGDGSLLTGITASGSGVVIKDDGSTVGTAGTIDFGTGLSVSFSSGTATVNASGGSGSSQWVTTDVGIHTLSNVGIGTTNPTSKLTVSGNASITGILTADQIYTSNNGNGQNVRIGDDLWIGDVNLANTTRFSGAQDSTKAFVIFGSSDSVALGRTGTGPLYYGGNFTVAGIVTASSFSGNASSATYATSSGIATYANTAGIATYATNAGVSTSVIGGIASVTQLNVSGISTLGVTSATNLTAQTLNVSGVTTSSGGFSGNLTGNVTGNIISYGNNSAATLSGSTVTYVNGNFTNGNIVTGIVTTISGTNLTYTGVGTITTFNSTNTTLTNINSSGISTLGVTSTTNLTTQQLNVSGLSTFSGIATHTAAIFGTTASFTGVVTASSFSGNASSATYATSAGIATYATSAGIATYATSAGIATYATSAGVATYATSAGIATYATSAGIASALTATASVNTTGIITASQLSTGASGTGINITTDTISGPTELVIDPAAVGDNTGAVRIKGDLYVDGTQTFINSTTIELADFNVGIATTIGTNSLLDGAGIGIGSTGIRKTLTWDNANTALKSSENFNLATGKVYEIDGTTVLSSNTLGSGVVNSSLTSVGTLTNLSVGNVNSTGIVTASNGFVGNLTGTATTATNLSDAANITTGTIAAARLSGTYNIDITGSAGYATTAGIATYATSSGIATYADYATTAGIATYATTAGIATYATSAGIATYATSSGIATYADYATSSGIATYATSAGLSTNVKGTGNSVLYNSATDTTTTSSNLTFDGTTLAVNSTPGANTSSVFLSGTPFGSNTKNGLLGIGTLGFNDNNIIANFAADVNSYAQVILQNLNSGNAASADFIVNSDSPLGQTYYGDFGINGTAYNGGGPFGDKSGTYLYAKGGTLSIGTDDAQDFRIATGSGPATPVTRVTVTGIGGSVGIGTTTPSQSLHIQGNVRITGGLYDSNNNVGTAGSVLSSTGTGLSWIPAPSGGGGGSTTRTTSRSVATESQTSFSVTYTVGYIDVYLNGSKLDSTEYTATNGTTVVLTEGASANDVLEFVTFSNIALSSATTVIDDTTTNADRYLTYTDATSGGISTIRVASTELTFNPGTNTFTTGNIVGTSLNVTGVSTLGTVSNLNVTGIGTITTLIPTQTRIQDAAEKITRVNGNTVSINYSNGGGNIGLCTNPTGNITLAVTGIPTDSSFDNHSILFSVFVIQTGTARTCNAVTLNGVSKTIKWPNGTVGSGTTNGYDIFNFIGINTVGSASTTANYEVLGSVNGGFR